jgi:dGTPase
MSGPDLIPRLPRLDDGLAPWAARDAASHGRRHPEPAPRYRSEYQRDRDRIIHSTAFRRLVYKTQVFVNHEGDLYRTRLTHSLEVAQIGRSIARTLGLNEALVEAVSLAHDLGHTPFGHAGQDALHACMRDFGGFEHNLQSLRVVDELEERYAEFDGLNLTFETREGILKHCSTTEARELGDLGRRFLERRQPGLEAQLANLADGIAYNNHDVDDGLRSGLVSIEQLAEIQLFRQGLDEVRTLYPGLDQRRTVHETVRRMIDRLVNDLIEESARRLLKAGVHDIEEARGHPGPLIAFSDTMRELSHELASFLRREFYQHYRVRRMTAKARRTVTALFEAFMDDPQLMPPAYLAAGRRLEASRGTAGRARAVCDYIAGMTDRYAIAEFRRLTDPLERT